MNSYIIYISEKVYIMNAPEKRTIGSKSSVSPDVSQEIKVINKTSNSVCVITPTVTPPVDDDPYAVGIYGQDLEYLNTTDKKSTLAEGETGLYWLNQHITIPEETAPVYIETYNLVVSSASFWKPVANFSVKQKHNAYTPVSATTADVTSMTEANAFYQTITAYPNSKLAANFLAAMQSTKNQANSIVSNPDTSPDEDADTLEESVNKFFKSTTSYKNVTLASFTSMRSYFQRFPFVWSTYGDKTYYLYASNGKQSTFQGTVALKNPSTLAPAKANGGYTISYTPAKDPTDLSSVDVDSSKSFKVLYQDGLFVELDNPESPSFALTPTFQVESTFTQNAEDDSIIPVLTGNVSGITVIGFDQPHTTSNPKDPFVQMLLHPKGTGQIIQSIMTWGGMVMMTVFVAEWTVKGVQFLRSIGKKTPSMEELFEKQQTKFSEMYQEQADKITKAISDGKQDNAPKNSQDAFDGMNEQGSIINDDINGIKTENSLVRMQDSVNEMGEYEYSMTNKTQENFEVVSAEVQENQNAMNNSNIDNFNEVSKEQMPKVKETSSSLNTLSEDMQASMKEESINQINKNKAQVKEIQDQIEENEESRKIMEDDENPKIDPLDEDVE